MTTAVATLNRPHPTLLERLLRGQLLARLAELRAGRLQVEDAYGTITLGAHDALAPPLRLQVIEPAFYRAIAAGGSV
ncbi:MAG: hypothetical protein ACP5P4_01980, partial [Steroidobacteraceae bacterium]